MNNLSFYKWFNLREADEYSPTVKNGLEIFMKPEEIFEISPASIADGNLTNTHKPFIYLESTDTAYLGETEGYHDSLINQKTKEVLDLLKSASKEAIKAKLEFIVI
jgi:hypothetical protein